MDLLLNEDNAPILPNSINQGEASEVLKRVPSNSVDMVMSSPPYGSTRPYNGFKYIHEHVAREISRVLKPGGVVVWNIADSTEKGFKRLEPMRHVLSFVDCGLGLYDEFIYLKNSSAFPARRDGRRYTNVFEHVYVLSKGRAKCVNLIADKENTWVGTMPFGKASQRGKDGNLVKRQRKPVQEFSPRDNVWLYYKGKGYTSKDPIVHEHQAVMPDLMPADFIRTFSNEGEIVMDVVAGSGTTLVMAKTFNRQYIGIEVSDEYCRLIEERLKFPHDREWLMKESARQYNSRFRPRDKKA